MANAGGMEVAVDSSNNPLPGMEGVASRVPFNQLCQLFEKMCTAKSNSVRRNEFINFQLRWKEVGKKIGLQNDSFYPALRLILPQADKDRLSYGVKEVMLAKIYVEVLGLSKSGQDARKLLEYRNPKNNLPAAGDFAQVAFQHVLSKRCIGKGDLTISQINDRLDDIGKFNNEKKKELVKKVLLGLVRQTSAIEQKWLIRVILKDMKLRLGQKATLLAFHPDAEDVYNVTTSLKQVCERLPDASVRLSEMQVEVFQPFRPMLALNARLDEIETLMNGREFSLEIKYDGERSQLHKEGGRYKYFSRNGKEYSPVFGETPYRGTLTPHIHSCFGDHVRSCVLDGEMMAYNPRLKIFVQKGGQFDIKHVTEDSELQPCLVLFDILYLNGRRLESEPQRERSRLLRGVAAVAEGRLQFAEQKPAGTNQEVVAALNEAIDRREEGVIVKDPASVYAPNKRKGSGWFKIKPEYAAGVVDDLDLVIIGGSFGSGRRGNFLSMFHLGVGARNPDNPTAPPAKYKSLARVGSGYTDQQLAEIIEKLKPHLSVFDKKRPPDWLMVGRERPEVFVHPRDSLVVQVRASEIVPSSSYATGCTLRFPRLVAVRDDKSCSDAMDEEQLRELRDLCDGKLAARHASLSAGEQPATKKRKFRVEAPAAVAADFRGADVSSVERVSSSFAGKTFCIITGSVDHDKQSLERRVAANEGSFVQNPVKDVHCVVARDSNNIRVKNAIRARKYDVIKADWLVRCLQRGSLSPWQPADVIHPSMATTKRFQDSYDRFGDEYAKDLTSLELKEIFLRIDEESIDAVAPESDHRFQQLFVNDVTSRCGFDDLPSHLLAGCTMRVLADDDDFRAKRLRALIPFYGGILCYMTYDVTHVVVTSSTELREVFDVRRSRQKKFHVVTDEWLHETIRHGVLAEEKHYVIPDETPSRHA